MGPLVNFQSGTRLTAANLNLMQNSFGVVKPANQSITSSVVLTNDNDLVIPASYLVAQATYAWWLFVTYNGGTQGSSDIQLNWVAPSGSIFRGTASYNNTSGAQVGAAEWDAANTIACGTNGTSNNRGIVAQGGLVMSNTVTAVQLQWCQNTSSGTATTVREGSMLLLQRLS